MEVEALKQTAVACAASGDLKGEIAALQQADDLGDAQAAILLGNALRQGQDVELARAAYERAEQRGHSEAGTHLGNLLRDLGERKEARLAFLRSEQLGSTLASLHLGLMLVDDKADDEALTHLQKAADAGESAGFLAIGKIHDRRRDWTAAAKAYHSGAQLGDSQCRLHLKMALFRQRHHGETNAPLQETGDGENQDAVEESPKSEQEDATAVVVSGPSVFDLWSDVDAVFPTLASRRKYLGSNWIAGTLKIREMQDRLNLLTSNHEKYLEMFKEICGRWDVRPGASDKGTDALLPTEWLNDTPQSNWWALTKAQDQAIKRYLNEANVCLMKWNRKVLRGGDRRQGIQALGRVLLLLDLLRSAIVKAEQQVKTAEQSRDSDARAAAKSAHGVLDPVASRARTASLELPPILQPWSSPRWASWTIEDVSNLGSRFAYAGDLSPEGDSDLGINASFGTDLRIPWLFTLRDSWLVRHEGGARLFAHAFVRSMMLRQLLSVLPGETRFCIFDPVGVGQSAGDLLNLAEYDPELIGGKVWSSPKDFESQLTVLCNHIELVIQKYLRTAYQTIDEFNDAAGEIAEPYRILVLFDFPTGLSADTAAKLKIIIENGPRCGVFTLAVRDTSKDAPYGVDIAQLLKPMRVLTLQGQFTDNIGGYVLKTSFDADVLPEQSDLTKRIIDGVGRASTARTESAVTFDKAFSIYRKVVERGLRPELGVAATHVAVSDPTTWWKDDSTRGLFAPIGQKGARDVAILSFDSGDHAGALMVGRPGSGKSTLLHTFIGGLTCLYGPDELELYLIDFKEGVEFKAYAEEKLPHAKVIAIESDREFGLSVLESLQAEITSRAELLRGTGGRQAGIQGLREATGKKVPRILLVFDEFQVLFARNDKVGIEASGLLESIIRQGRGFGVHVLLGSQSLAGLDALGKHVPQLLPVRILLPAAEVDARQVLGDGNNAGDYLTSHGEGILNAAGGAVEANERFKGALQLESDRIAQLRVMRDKANESGFTRVPMVFEGNALLPLHAQHVRQYRDELMVAAPRSLRIRTGVPMTVGEIGDLVLTREAGANVLAIVRNGDNDLSGAEIPTGPGYGLLAAAVSSAAIGNAVIDIIDFMPNEDGLDILLEPLLGEQRLTLKRRRAFPDVLTDYATEVARRVTQEDYDGRAMLLVLFGIHRARDLDTDSGSLDADHDLLEKLEQVVRNGPEVGVHVWFWSDSVAGASRRLSSHVLREIGWRIAGKMGGDDSQSFVGGGQAAELRDSQVVLVNEDQNVVTRMTAYSPPTVAWLRELAVAQS